MVKNIVIKDNYIPELIEVFGKNWQEEIDGKANPETKAGFASRKFDEELKAYVNRRIQSHRAEVAKKSISDIEIAE